MNNDIAVKHVVPDGLKGIDAKREINRVAKSVINRSISTVDQLTKECYEIAHDHYVKIAEVYQQVWAKVGASEELHQTHPAGKTKAYHALRESAER